MCKYVLFGAGNYAKIAIKILGQDNIEYIVDNDQKKSGSEIEGIAVFSYTEKFCTLRKKKIIIAVSEKYEKEIVAQLENDGIEIYDTIKNIRVKKTKENIENSINHLQIYNKAIGWIERNIVPKKGVIISSEKKVSYPEVSGYYICSLLKWGYKDEAVGLAKWLMSIQKEDGSWMDPYGKDSYVFDSAQILKGLLAIRGILPQVKKHILDGCEWILSNIDDEGRMKTPSEEMWGKKNMCSELVHIYCLSPLVEASVVYGVEKYKDAAYRVLDYYKSNFEYDIKNFNLLSHFYAYVVEGLLDMGEVEWTKEAMINIERYQKDSGEVPGYNNVDWICSTGLFQLALIWFRLGNLERGNKAFEYACHLQNASGGWFGSYLSQTNMSEVNTYFPNDEISWAVKYFLDALYYKNIAEFENMAPCFLEKISFSDGRYLVIKDEVKKSGANSVVADIGCGKGRYLKNLIDDFPNNKYFAVDISSNVMRYIENDEIEIRQGTLTNIPFEDDTLDICYTCEAIEHAVDLKTSIREMVRVTKDSGTIVVIDKNKSKYGALEIGEWEFGPEENELRMLMEDYCSEVEIIKNIAYDEKHSDGLFYAWIGKVGKKDRE